MIGLSGARTPRLGIPKVNQNPRPPGSHFKAALANRVAAHPHLGVGQARPVPRAVSPAKPVSTPTAATTTAQPTNTVAAPAQSAPQDPFKAAAESTSNGTLFPIPSYTPEAGKPDPRDSTYWNALSKLIFTDSNEYSKNLAEQSTADAGYAQATKEAIAARATQQRQLGEKLMGTGLTQSGFHDRTEGEQNTAYTNARAQASLTKEQEDQARRAARDALTQGYGIDSAALLAEAAGRLGEGEGKNAENAPGEPTEAASAGAGKGGGKGKGKGKGSGKPKIGIGNAKPVGHAPRVGVSNNRPASPYKTALANRRKAK